MMHGDSIRWRGVVLGVLFTAWAQAGIVSVSNVSGVGGLIIAAPGQVLDDAIGSNTHQLGFDEVQDFVLPRDISVDGGGTIAAGTRVNSHMILLNRASGSDILAAVNDWAFDGQILGTMSNDSGSLEVATSDILGAAGTTYPGAPFAARGLESGDDSLTLLNPTTLRVEMVIAQPGDWVRVVTAVVPEPATGLAVLVGTTIWGTRRRGA